MKIFANEEIERLVLGQLSGLALPSDGFVCYAMDKLVVECFTSIGRKSLFRLMQARYLLNEPISDADLMGAMSDEDFIWLSELRYEPFSINCFEDWIEELVNLRMDRVCQSIIENSLALFNKEKDRGQRRDILTNLPELILRVGKDDLHSSGYLMSPNDAIDEFEGLEAKGMQFVRTGIRDLDKLLGGGFLPGSLVVIGAPPSGGKTHLSLKILMEIQHLQADKRALVFTLEGRRYNTWARLMSHRIGKLYKNMSAPEQQIAKSWARKSNIYVSEKPGISVEHIRASCKNASMKGGISIVLVDYLDRVGKSSGPERTDEKLANIANELSDIATTFNCIVILTTQLNKEAIKRDDKRPKAYDSKNSNGAAEAAWYWFGVKRIAQWDEGRIYSDSSLVELILDKAREGEQGIVWFDTKNSLYFDIDQQRAKQLVDIGNADRKMKFENKKTDNSIFEQYKDME